ncbi:hypothetical protein KQI84_15555 [bacterium]|nr:hypothetical protein [bacterium]
MNSTGLILEIHGVLGDKLFIAGSLVISVILSLWAIPQSTHVMVNSAAGLAGRHLGRKWRTLTINASTNNPEAASMLVSFGMRRMGGWANPLGSLFANIYLMYIVALIWVSVKFLIKGRPDKVRELFRLIGSEKRLVAFHVAMSFFLFAMGYAALRVLLGDGEPPQFNMALAITVVLLVIALIVFHFVEGRLKRKRPELFEDIDEEEHNESWGRFLLGTAAVVASCWAMNMLFLGWSELYRTHLEALFGVMIFTWLHWFVGSFITSLPEITIAIHNYEKLKRPDLNTALGSTTYSNMVNIAIALFGLVIWMIMSGAGVSFTW